MHDYDFCFPDLTLLYYINIFLQFPLFYNTRVFPSSNITIMTFHLYLIWGEGSVGINQSQTNRHNLWI